ncbi:MAG: efflux RND transporter periplasmic adaptor subunit [Gemmatimonadota bacterium]
MTRRRWIVVFALLGIVALAVAYGFRARPVVVEAGRVTRGPLRVTVAEEGRTRVTDRFVVSSPVAGIARRIDLEVGDPVRRGGALVVIEPLQASALDPRSRAEAEARVSGARAGLSAARENAREAAAHDGYAQTRLGRTRGLFEAGIATRDALDQAETEARRSQAARRAAEFAVEIAGHDLEAARTALRYSAVEGAAFPSGAFPIRSPVAGRVLGIPHKSAGVVAPGQPLIEIGDPAAIEVEAEVLSVDAVRLRPGMRVLFERWGGDRPLEGTVRVVEPAGFTKVSALGVEEQRVHVIADIATAAEGRERLGDGYRVEARFIVWEARDVLQVPAGALFRHGDGWAAFAIREGKARLRPVRIGHRGELAVEILSGLSEGETIVVHAGDSVSDGVRVRAR